MVLILVLLVKKCSVIVLNPTEISDTVNYINQDDLQYAIDNDLKSFEFSSHSSIETLYLGDRSSPLYFKIYDKRKNF